MEPTILAWAHRHPQIRGVVLGGSRAKGTAQEGSDWDFGVLLDEEPSVELVEHLTADVGLASERDANVAPQLERAFVIVSKSFRTEEGEIALNFTDVHELDEAFDHKNYTIIEHQLEFLTSAKLIYDPQGTVEAIRSRPFPEWAREKLIDDALGLAEWNIDKYRKARSTLTRMLLKSNALWFCAKAIAAHNGILLTYRYGYDAFSEYPRSADDFRAPDGLFDTIDRSVEREGIEDVERIYTRIKEFIRG